MGIGLSICSCGVLLSTTVLTDAQPCHGAWGAGLRAETHRLSAQHRSRQWRLAVLTTEVCNTRGDPTAVMLICPTPGDGATVHSAAADSTNGRAAAIRSAISRMKLPRGELGHSASSGSELQRISPSAGTGCAARSGSVQAMTSRRAAARRRQRAGLVGEAQFLG